MITPYPYAWSWAEERRDQIRRRRRRLLTLAAEIATLVLLAGGCLALAWRVAR